MTTITRSAILPYTAPQIFDLVNDVHAYPDFLPWCKATTIFEQSPLMMHARIDIHKAGVTQSFATLNTLNYPYDISMQFKKGPFKKLQGHWSFQPLGDKGCKVVFDLTFEFDFSVMGIMLKKIMGSAANDMVDAFSQRAKVIYG
jgi:ribosome-associated toxin RatA of RatAB toxin-antitoxin module